MCACHHDQCAVAFFKVLRERMITRQGAHLMRPTKEHLCARIPPSASGLARTYLLRVSAGASSRLLLRKPLCSRSTSCPLQLNGVVGQRMSPCCRWKIPSVHQLWMPLGLQMSCHSCHEGMLMETESMEALAWEIHGRDAGRHSTDDN